MSVWMLAVAGLVATPTAPLTAAVKSAGIMLEFGPAPTSTLTIEVAATSFRLKNGLTVILHEDHRLPRVAVEVRYLVGSSDERPKQTGLAHLFEHLMFEGSANVPEGAFDEWLEAAGGSNNGTTDEDFTLYYENVPAGALELALFLEADRMATLLSTMSEDRVNGQRDVVKNERRQSYENRPYGRASLLLPSLLFPTDHPYSWPVIGSMADLSAASQDDVRDFFQRHYAPENAILTLAGDIDVDEAKLLVEKTFGRVPHRTPPSKSAAPVGRELEDSAPEPLAPLQLSKTKEVFFEDDVQLPQLTLAWVSPALFASGDAELDIIANALTSGRSSRLYQRLVVKERLCQSIYAGQWSARRVSTFAIIARARPGVELAKVQAIIAEELAMMARDGPTDLEVRRAVTGFEAGFLDSLERNSGRGGKANRLSLYQSAFGTPDGFTRDLARYQTMTRERAKNEAARLTMPHVQLSVVPRGQKALATAGAIAAGATP